MITIIVDIKAGPGSIIGENCLLLSKLFDCPG